MNIPTPNSGKAQAHICPSTVSNMPVYRHTVPTGIYYIGVVRKCSDWLQIFTLNPSEKGKICICIQIKNTNNRSHSSMQCARPTRALSDPFQTQFNSKFSNSHYHGNLIKSPCPALDLTNPCSAWTSTIIPSPSMYWKFSAGLYFRIRVTCDPLR